MAINPSGIGIVSPKLRDQSVVRRFVSQGGRGYLSLGTFDGANPVDVDPGTISLRVWYKDPTVDFPSSDDQRGNIILELDSNDIVHADTGKYYYDIGPEATTQRGVLTAEWTYQVNSNIFQYNDYLQVLDQMPLYERLSDDEKNMVEQVSWMLGDLYDSTEGGPHLIEEFQTHFGYERIAQLAQIAMVQINTLGYGKPTSFGFGGQAGMGVPPSSFNGLIVIGTYLTIVKHLIRSYTEIPARPNVSVPYVDRRDYAQRWQQVYQIEYPEWKAAVKAAKIGLLNLGRSSILVSGGIYGGGAGGHFRSGMWSMQARAGRWYPAAAANFSYPAS